MKKRTAGLLAACAMYMNPAAASNFIVSIELPSIDVAEYHWPCLDKYYLTTATQAPEVTRGFPLGENPERQAASPSIP